jgi:hypothetical protein
MLRLPGLERSSARWREDGGDAQSRLCTTSVAPVDLNVLMFR